VIVFLDLPLCEVSYFDSDLGGFIRLYPTDHGVTPFEVRLSSHCLPRKDQRT
jgi:hypothetical protein